MMTDAEIQAMLDRRTVYVFFDAEDRPLYVGCSTAAASRLSDHSAKPWFRNVATAHFEHFAHARDAAERERYLIRHLDPLHNVDGRVPRAPRRKLPPTEAAA